MIILHVVDGDDITGNRDIKVTISGCQTHVEMGKNKVARAHKNESAKGPLENFKAGQEVEKETL